MKKNYLLLLFVICSLQISAQGFYSIAHAVDSLYPSDTTEDGPKAKIERISKRWNGQFDQNGKFTTAAQNFKNFATNLVNYRSQNSNCSNDFVPTWKEVGPRMESNNTNSLQGAGLIHKMTFHPNYDGVNNQTIFAISAFGGIWKTEDDGENWQRLNTDLYIPFSATGNLVIDPINPNRMYVTTGHPNDVLNINTPTGIAGSITDYPIYTTGLYATDNGGETWVQINNGLATSNLFNGGTIFNLMLDPTNPNNLIFTSTDGIYICKNPTGALSTILWAKDLSFTFSDIQIKGLTFAYNGANPEWFVSGTNIYYCPNPFATSPTPWSLATGVTKNLDLTNGNYQGLFAKEIIQINLVNSPFHANNKVYALIYIRERNPAYDPSSNPYVPPYFYEVAIHTLALPNILSTQWQNVLYNAASSFAGGLHKDKIPFVVSPMVNSYYFGSTHYGSSLNGTFSESYGNNFTGNHHADIQGLYIHPSQPTKLWMCSDGGISVAQVLTTHNQWGFTYKNKGIQAQLLWDFDDSEQDKDYFLAALQDNFVQFTGGNAGSNWKMATGNGGDGYNASIIDIDKTDAYFRGSNAIPMKFNYLTNTACVFNTSNPSLMGLYYKHNPDNYTERLTSGYQILKHTTSPCVAPPNNLGGFSIYWDPSLVNMNFNYKNAPKVINYSSVPIFEVVSGKVGSNTYAYGVTGYKVDNFKPSAIVKSVNGFSSPPTNTDYFNAVDANAITNALYDAAAIPGNAIPVISDICTLPNDGNSVWVSSSGLISNFKVWKSVNGGTTWTNADPYATFANIPVFEVQAVEGANGIVFAGTLDGVYYTDNTMAGHWCRYGNSPTLQIFTLKINYCKNKLIVGTYGRGAFEVDLPFQPVPSTNITTSTTWSTPQNFPNTSVTVKTGAILTIQNTTVKFGPNSRLYVEAGAKLVINNATLTAASECNGYLWKGIELQGDQNQKQILSGSFYPYHGWCVMTNSATVQNAEAGIKSYATVNGDGWSIDWAKMGGGIVQCTNAKFLNCSEGAKFIPYINKNALNQIVNDKSFFTTTQFLTDATSAIYNYTPGSHVIMWGTRGIGLTSNTFKNNTPASYTTSKRGNGLITWDATFTTTTPCLIFGKTDCNTYGTPNLFENLYYGVDAGASVATAIANINVSKFTNNHRSIILRGTTQSSVFRNLINIGDAYTESTGLGTGMLVSYPYGLYLDVCDAYNVKENTFNDNTNNATDTDYGIIVSNTGVNTNMLKQNTFSNVAYGIQAQEENYDLQLKCNKFTTATINAADVKVMGLQMQGSIAQQQGGCTQNATDLPGNEFSHTCSSAKDLNSNGNVLYQVTYNTRVTVSQEVPQSGCYNTTDFFVNYCSNPPTGVVCAAPTGGHLRLAQANAGQELQNMTNTIAAKQQLLSDADAHQLYVDIINNTNESVLKQNLIQVGPYLSDNLLIAFINHTPMYSDATIKDVLVANSPLSPTVLAAFNQLTLANVTKNQILAAQTGMSQRTYLQNEIKYYTTVRVLLYNDIINDVLNDSTNMAVYDTLYTKLDFTISPQSRNLYISALMEQGKFGQAQAQIAMMRQAGESAENCDYLEAILALKQQTNKTSAYQSNTTISSKINPLLNKWPLGKSVNANVLHSALFGKTYKEQVYIDHTKPQNQRFVEEEKPMAFEKELQVLAFPNPANTDVNFVIDGIKENETCLISIYDINGRLMMEFNVQENKLPKSISLTTFSSGIYFYKALTGDKIYQNKLVIIK